MVSKAIVERAWEMRQRGIYTMREIADSLGVGRIELIEAIEQQARDAQQGKEADHETEESDK